MTDKLKVINFLQDFGCAKIQHLQVLFSTENDNFKNIINSNIISKKGDILVYSNFSIIPFLEKIILYIFIFYTP